MAQKAGGQLAEKLRKDVEAALAKELGDNPELVAKVEGILKDVGEIAADDVIGSIHNPIVRVVVKTAIHDTIDAAFEAI